MKKIFLLAAVFCSCSISYSQSTDRYQKFILNDTFSHVQPKHSKIKPQNYQLSSYQGFKLDCTNYDFTLIKSMNDRKNPDAIFIVSKAGNFMVPLNINGETIVDKSTMKSIDNPKKIFNLFEKSDTPILGIGTLKIKNGTASMTTYWVTMIDVK